MRFSCSLQINYFSPQVKQLKTVLKNHRVPEKEYSDPFLTTIYVITPTYARPHQKAELTR